MTLLSLLLLAVAFLATAYFVPGFKVSGFASAFIAAIIYALFSGFLWWAVAFLTAPLSIITFGIFLFFISAIVIRIIAAFVPGFQITSWLAAFIGALLLAFFNALFRWMAGLGKF